MPMMRPMFLQWPDDKGCQGKDVEDQFMFGESAQTPRLNWGQA